MERTGWRLERYRGWKEEAAAFFGLSLDYVRRRAETSGVAGREGGDGPGRREAGVRREAVSAARGGSAGRQAGESECVRGDAFWWAVPGCE